MRGRSRAYPRRRALGTRIGGTSALVALLGLLGGCGGSPAYLARSAWEEARILWGRTPITEVVSSPSTPPQVREKLELVLAVRAFAAESLGLDVGRAYASFSEVSDGALLHVVSAARQDRLEPYTWWFPIVGDVTYKGFFERADAEAEARRLEAEGYDTYVRPSVAFSTLGWFDDPVLSSWLEADRLRLAELVIHELLHRTTYLSGQTAFNESYANFVGHRGAIAFFVTGEGEDTEQTKRAREAWQSELAASEKLGRALGALRALYATAEQERWPLARVLDERRAVFAELGDPARINNALLLARSAYQDRLRAFEAAAAGQPDLRAAIARITSAAEKSPHDPFAAVDHLAAPPAFSAGALSPAGPS